MRAAIVLLREATASVRSQPVTSLLTIAMVAGMCVAALLTTGRTVAAERAVLAQIDAADTRSIVVRADLDAGLTASLLDELQAVHGIEALAGFGPITDGRNAAVPGAAKVAIRHGYGTVGGRELLTHDTATAPASDVALASAAAVETLGLHDGTGALLADDGREVVVTGDLPVPRHLRFLEPLVVIPSSTAEAAAGHDRAESLVVLVILAESPPAVAAVESTVRSFLSHLEPGQATVETSAELAAIRAAVRGELGTHGRATVLGILGVSAGLVAINLLAMVTMRRKDFGRRRALGASRSLIINLLMAQTLLLSSLGVSLGTAASLVVLVARQSPLPGPEFAVALAVSGVVTAMLAALPPAVAAARRDPLYELRVP